MAVTKGIVATLIKEGQELIDTVEFFDRKFDSELTGRHVLVGIRQAGKSYMLYKIAKQLISEGHCLEEFLYIDFDDERLLEMTVSDFDLILQTYMGMYPHKPILLLDEIQNISGWEHFARRLANQKYSVYITGSNAKMLSRDIHTTLGGRYVNDNVFPYSFSEFLGAKGIHLEKGWEYGSLRYKVEQMFSDYFRWGGFPELLLFQNKRRWLNDIYEKILLGDIVLRNKIKNETALRLCMKRIAESIGKPISYNRLANLIKSAGTNTTVVSLMQYVSHALDSCMVIALDNYASKFVERESIKKYYFADNGLVSVFMSDSDAALLENLCALQLYRRYGSALTYYNKNVEVDFYVEAEKIAVQACVSLSDEETLDRELKALESLDSVENLSVMQIITIDTQNELRLKNGKMVEAVPVWKWLLY